MLEWGLLPLKRYADFSGRSRRREYWFFALLYLIVMAILYAAVFGMAGGAVMAGANSAGATSAGAGVFMVSLVILILALALFIPSLAVTVRRFHDQDKSGWMVLLALIPFIGGLILLVFMCLEGTRGPNRYGPDPKETETPVAAE